MAKFRQSFVTNSSSSSYIVIGNTNCFEQEGACVGKTYTIGKYGECQFGWQNELYNECESRINFAYLQCMAVKNTDWWNMICEVIKEHTGAIEVESLLTDEINTDYYKWGYIDHQSCASEGENTEMFASKEKLKNFLFNRGSYIQCGNDNE